MNISRLRSISPQEKTATAISLDSRKMFEFTAGVYTSSVIRLFACRKSYPDLRMFNNLRRLNSRGEVNRVDRFPFGTILRCDPCAEVALLTDYTERDISRYRDSYARRKTLMTPSMCRVSSFEVSFVERICSWRQRIEPPRSRLR